MTSHQAFAHAEHEIPIIDVASHVIVSLRCSIISSVISVVRLHVIIQAIVIVVVGHYLLEGVHPLPHLQRASQTEALIARIASIAIISQAPLVTRAHTHARTSYLPLKRK